MKVANTPLNWLRAFEVSARHLNISAAAKELHVTPAAVSQQVRLLERRVGVALFERNARGVRLTRAGESLLPACRESFERMDAALLELFGKSKGDRLVVRVLLGFARKWLLQTVAEFSALHPDIPVRLVASVWSSEAPDASVDVDLHLASSAPKGLESHQLSQDRIFPVCAPPMALQFKRSKKAVDWSAQTLLHSIGFAQGWPQWFAASDIKRKLTATDIEFDSAQLCLEAAALGHGIALTRTSFAADYLENNRLTVLSKTGVLAKDQMYLSVPLGLHPKAPAALFRDHVVRKLRGK